jgi:hypothetical protein
METGLDRVVTMSPAVRELIDALTELGTTWGARATVKADALEPLAHAVIMAEGDRGVWEQTLPGNGTYAETAAVLGSAVQYLRKRRSRHVKVRAAARKRGR